MTAGAEPGMSLQDGAGAGGCLPAQSRGYLQDGAGAGVWLPAQSRRCLQDGAGTAGCIRKADVRRGAERFLQTDSMTAEEGRKKGGTPKRAALIHRL